jgi:predicted O-methyltransferase YrrM
MKNLILELKPKSIFDVVKPEFFLELGTTHDEYLKSNNYYEYYYAISKHYQPKKILEIGVRYGYSLGVMVSGSNNIEKVVGIDCDDYEKNSLNVAEENIKKYIKTSLEYTFLNVDSHTITKFDDFYDLIHIDGDHSYEGKIKDLNLLKNSCKVAIVDDYNFLPQVRKAADEWVLNNSEIIKSYYILESIRGTLIIEFNEQ